MKKAVTINDIVKTLGYSRNTISRALNNSATVTPSTRRIICEKARELGYKGYAYNVDEISGGDNRTIAFLTRSFVDVTFFFSSVIRGVESYLSERGYILTLALIRPVDIENLTLPATLRQASGIICADIFNGKYLDAVFGTGIPVVLVESYWDLYRFNQPHSVIMMENDENMSILTGELLMRGHRKIAFVGDPWYSRGFYERYRGYVSAHIRHGILPNPEFCLADIGQWIEEVHIRLPSEPTAYVCANDSIGIAVIQGLLKRGVQIPREVEVVGFDGLPEGNIIMPALTTVNTLKHELGERACKALIDRINNPDAVTEVIYLPTSIVYRGSTRNE